MRFTIIIAALLGAPLAASEVAVPSGRSLLLFDVIMETDMARFRFVLPDIADDVSFVDLVDDLQFVCDAVAVPALAEAGSSVSQMVVSVSAAEVAFGEPTDVTQYFQPFRIDSGACVWEEF